MRVALLSKNRNVQPPLDTVSGVVAAFGLRRLRSAYAGKCINVRRSTDQATTDVGFSGNDLDIAGFLAFVGAGSGFCVTAYDQGTNGLNATQATAANQPQVVISNGQPLISFLGVAGKVLATANDARAYPGLTVATVLKSLGTLGTFCGTSDAGFTVGWFWEQNNQPPNAAVELRNQVGTAFVGSTDGGSSNQGNGLLHANFARLSASIAELYEDGRNLPLLQNTMGSITTTTGQPIVLGDDLAGGDAPLPMLFAEMMFWASARSDSDRNTIHSNQRTYWGTP